jgi:lysophospholipase L1-like esterase
MQMKKFIPKTSDERSPLALGTRADPKTDQNRLMFLATILTGVLGLALLTTAGVSAASGPIYQGPQAYYLALGDSMAYGVQPAKVNAGLPPSGFRTGYVNLVGARLQALAPKIQVVNYGCPGESSKTFIDGGCPWLAQGGRLHNAFEGSQLKAALAFLRAHRGHVSPITVTLWGGDVFDEFSPACKGDLACIRKHASAGLTGFASRLASIVGQLRAAAPKAEIILTGAWNFDVEHLPQSDPLFRSIDARIARVAAADEARVAHIYPVFSPVENPAKAKGRICALTFICSKGDPHPTDAGYRAMAAAFLTASGYAHRS